MDAKEETAQFYELDTELRRKYMLAECLMLNNDNAASVRQLCTVINVMFCKLSRFARSVFSLNDLNSDGQPILSCLDTAKLEFDKRVEDWFKSVSFNAQNNDVPIVSSVNFNSQNYDARTVREPDVLRPPSVAGSASSSRSSVLRRAAYVEAKLARLELEQDKERQREKVALDKMSRELSLREKERKVELSELKLAAWDEQLSESSRKEPYVTSKVEPAVFHDYRSPSTANPATYRQSAVEQVIASVKGDDSMPPFPPQREPVKTGHVDLPNNMHRRQINPEEKACEDAGRLRKTSRQSVQNRTECGPSLNRLAYPGDDFWSPNWGNEEIARVPKPELAKFNGDPLDYFEFTRNFDLHIGNLCIADAKKMTFLLQYCDVEVRRQLSHFSKDLLGGYRSARNQLWQLYGQPHVISRACSSLLSKTPTVKDEDPSGLLQLSILLQKCRSALSDIGEYAGINSLHCLLPILKKLPKSLQEKWIEWSVDVADESKREAGFVDLANFVGYQSRLWNSLFGQSLYGDTQSRQIVEKRKRASLFNVAAEQSTVKRSSSKSLRGTCLLCNERHNLDSCCKFAEKSVVRRRDFVLKNALCFRCLLAGHVVSECKAESRCGECESQFHHTLLHKVKKSVDERKHEETTCSSALSAAYAASKTCNKVFMCVVPVKVRYQNKEVKTYAFLDSGSSATFCSRKLVDRLGITGEKKEVSLKTLGSRSFHTGTVADLKVSSLDGDREIEVRNVFSIDKIPVTPNPALSRRELEEFSHLRDLSFPEVTGASVTLLIGVDVPEALWVEEVRKGSQDEPCAWKSPFGWSLMGKFSPTKFPSTVNSNFIQIGEDGVEEQLRRMYEADFGDATEIYASRIFRENRVAHEQMKKSVVLESGRFELPLPKRASLLPLPENRAMAEKRLKGLKKRLTKDESMCKKYVECMQNYIDKGFAEEVCDSGLEKTGVQWFIPHHPVVHPRKPGKVRIVFDCAAKYQGVSLNDVLLQGPDFLNSLVGVLTRFRKERVALVADIEGMYHQIKVHPKDRNMLSFLWWKSGRFTDKPSTYRMTSHLFGAKSSPSVALFCLRETEEKFGKACSIEVREAVKRNFYVDDCLVSVATVEQAQKFAADLKTLLLQGGFSLKKWASNHHEALATLPEEDLASSVQNLNLGSADEREQRVLGVVWKPQDDVFSFKVEVPNRPETKRGILSIISSVFDPLGFAAPVLITGRLLWQEMCRKGYDWDDLPSEEESIRWREWADCLNKLQAITVPRCIKPSDFGQVKQTELHIFADASTSAYAAVAYLRLVDEQDLVHCSFVMGKARVSPLSTMSVPRLELTATVLAAKLDVLTRKELDLTNCMSTIWSDSTAVLQTLYNSYKRFPTFVANRVAEIERCVNVNCFRFVPTDVNPADDTTRGLSTDDLSKQSRWLHGPEFLLKTKDLWPEGPIVLSPVPDEFLPASEKSAKVNLVLCNKPKPIDNLISKYSSWHRLKKAVAWVLRYKTYLRCKAKQSKWTKPAEGLITDELKQAETAILQYEQKKHFNRLIDDLRKDKVLGKDSCSPAISKLNPILDNNLIRVGGRIDLAPVSYDQRHPIILPCKSHVTDLIIASHHEKVGHSGVGHTISSLWQRFWIVKVGVAVRSVLGNCLLCKRRAATPCSQMMADLPLARLQVNQPVFSHVGIDYFGPILIRQGRSEVKRYGCLFTCLSTRAVHLEVARDLSTDCFINCLRRFSGRRGQPLHIYSDNGTNFVGAEKVLRTSLEKWNKQVIEEYLRQKEVVWSFNPPAASARGGAWERLIRSVRRILSTLWTPKVLLTDEMLQTFLVEVESIINSRPLVPLTIDARNNEPLTPNHLLLLRGSPSQCPGVFEENSQFSRQKWMYVQHLANVFWKRWIDEFLPMLNKRQKWLTKEENLKRDSIVLLVDERVPRARWSLGRVVDVYPDKRNLIRTVLVKTKSGLVKRPVNKLCLILDSDTN